MDCFIRRFWQVLGVIGALAVAAMVILAIASPRTCDMVTARLIHALLPWITVGVMVGIVWKVVIGPMLPKPPAKGKKGG